MVGAGVCYLEECLKKQLRAAVGRELTAEDFRTYMARHARRIFTSAAAPKPLSHAVRRSPAHAPEGQVSLETLDGEENEVAATFQRRVLTEPTRDPLTGAEVPAGNPEMKFRLDAATEVRNPGREALGFKSFYRQRFDSPPAY
eukprot:4818846-Pyramimonas_sp.AAC.2